MDIGYFQWVTYCFPFVIVMIPLTWLVVNWRFKPRITSLAPAMENLQREIGKMGAWNRQQKIALVIFIVMIFGWFTEKEFYTLGIYPVRLGIGVIAVAGAVAYLLAGVVNWRDYQEKVDWGRGMALCRRHYLRENPGRNRRCILVGPNGHRGAGTPGNGFRAAPDGNVSTPSRLLSRT